MTPIRRGCCSRAASGQAAAPPSSSVMHSHLVGLLSCRERIAHLGRAGDPALRNFNPAYVSLGVMNRPNASFAESPFSPPTAGMCWSGRMSVVQARIVI
jgi:hypothetical protein